MLQSFCGKVTGSGRAFGGDFESFLRSQHDKFREPKTASDQSAPENSGRIVGDNCCTRGDFEFRSYLHYDMILSCPRGAAALPS